MAEAELKRRKDFLDMKKLLEDGWAFSKIFTEKVPRLHAVSAIIEQGELSGKLVDSLKMAQELLERSDELRKKCLSALMYPLVIGLFSVLLTLGLVRGVMPQIIPLLLSLRVELPLLTRAVIFLSTTITSYGIYICVVLIISYLGFLFTYRRKTGFRLVIQRILGMTPLVGPLIKLYWLAHFLRIYGSLLASGVSSPKSYEGAASALTYLPLQRYLVSKSSSVFEGAHLGSVFTSREFSFPPYVAALVAAGESSGHLADSLLRAAELIDRDLSYMLKKLTSLIEPLMMAAMGVVVGAIALSIMMPIYDISKVLQK